MIARPPGLPRANREFQSMRIRLGGSRALGKAFSVAKPSASAMRDQCWYAAAPPMGSRDQESLQHLATRGETVFVRDRLDSQPLDWK
jgi:hypothetical protein